VAATQHTDQDDMQSLVTLINNQIAMLRKRLKEKEAQQQAKKEWFLVASIIDRISLFAYILAMCFGLIIVFA
jgi:hypothetical protein